MTFLLGRVVCGQSDDNRKYNTVVLDLGLDNISLKDQIKTGYISRENCWTERL